jgi:hypothetical protein
LAADRWPRSLDMAGGHGYSSSGRDMILCAAALTVSAGEPDCRSPNDHVASGFVAAATATVSSAPDELTKQQPQGAAHRTRDAGVQHRADAEPCPG